MQAPTFFAVVSNVPDSLNGPVIEALVAAEAEKAEPKPVVVALGERNAIRTAPGRPGKDDPIQRYCHAATRSGAPILTRGEAASLVKDLGKERNADLAAGRSFLVLLDAVPAGEAAKAFDAFCFVVTENRASLAFAYSGIRAVRQAGGHSACRLVVADQAQLEKAAELFLEIRGELGDHPVGGAELGFCGSVGVDREELELAESAGLPLLEAFPGGATHGQARYAARRLFARPPIEGLIGQAERLALFGALLK